MRTQRDQPKCANACNHCRARKVKCSGDPRCTNCFDHDKECIYPRPQRRKRKHDIDGSRILEERIARVEAALNTPGPVHVTEFTKKSLGQSPFQWAPVEEYATVNSQSYASAGEIGRSPENGRRQVNERRHSTGLAGQMEPMYSQANAISTPCSMSTKVVSPHSVAVGVSTSGPTNFEDYSSDKEDIGDRNVQGECEVDKEDCIVAPQKINLEHHGPTSWLSICSAPGIAWVSDKTGAPDFARVAKGLTQGWTRRLRLDCGVTRERAPEVDATTAWKYCKAYFEESYDAVFGVIFCPAFEARLRQHFDENAPDDSSWYALRHVVYASGCRILLSKDPSVPFVEAQRRAWRYFENAISVYTDLLFTPTGLPAVQALVMMCYYIEGLGSPSLEYMFCSGAVRLAQAKGLHRQPARAWNLSESEVLHRNWLWWAIYCFDKHIAKRSARPSAIDDDDISCQIPTRKVQHSTIDVEVFTSAVKHAQISSQISRKLGTVKAFQSNLTKLIDTVADLTNQLQEWYDGLPARLKSKVGRTFMQPISDTRIEHIMYLHNAFHGSLMAVHSIFTLPWISAYFGSEKNQFFRSQVVESNNIVAEAARNIILTTRYIEISAASPHWLCFSYPMFGLVNLFISLLKNPTSAYAQSDLALMEMVAGHFAHMEYVTSSELSFPFTREVSALARQTVIGAVERGFSTAQVTPVTQCDLPIDTDGNFFDNIDTLDMLDFDMESWNVFSSVAIDGTSTQGDFVFRSY